MHEIQSHFLDQLLDGKPTLKLGPTSMFTRFNVLDKAHFDPDIEATELRRALPYPKTWLDASDALCAAVTTQFSDVTLERLLHFFGGLKVVVTAYVESKRSKRAPPAPVSGASPAALPAGDDEKRVTSAGSGGVRALHAPPPSLSAAVSVPLPDDTIRSYASRLPVPALDDARFQLPLTELLPVAELLLRRFARRDHEYAGWHSTLKQPLSEEVLCAITTAWCDGLFYMPGDSIGKSWGPPEALRTSSTRDELRQRVFDLHRLITKLHKSEQQLKKTPNRPLAEFVSDMNVPLTRSINIIVSSPGVDSKLDAPRYKAKERKSMSLARFLLLDFAHLRAGCSVYWQWNSCPRTCIARAPSSICRMPALWLASSTRAYLRRQRMRGGPN
jgi:hypothetical protein